MTSSSIDFFCRTNKIICLLFVDSNDRPGIVISSTPQVISLDCFELCGCVFCINSVFASMSNTPSPTDSELLADSPRGLSELVDPQTAKTYYQTVYISPESSQDTLILPDNMNQAPSTSKHQFVQGATVPNPAFEQAVNTPLPPSPTMQQSWTPEEIIILQEHLIFHTKMIEAINTAAVSGPQKLPKPPKRKLENLFKEKGGKLKKTKKVMTPQGFHNYLFQHIQDMTKSISREAFLFKVGEDVHIDQAINQLKNAYKHLCRQNSQSMVFNCEFGNFLNELYKWFEQMKIQGLITMSWQVWLNTHINISASHASSLRQLSSIVNGFPKLKTIDLPLREVLQNLKLLKEMLTVPEYFTFWASAVAIPFETTSSQEQVVAKEHP